MARHFHSSGDDLVDHTNTGGLDEGIVHIMAGRMAYDVPSGDDYVVAMQKTNNDSYKVLVENVTHWDPHGMSNGNLLIGVYRTADGTLGRLVEFDAQRKEVR